MILVIGATGNIGRHVVSTLYEKKIKVRAVSRDTARAHHLLPDGVEVVEADLTQTNTIDRVLNGISKVYLATNGPDQIEVETNVIKAVQNSQVDHLVKVSVIGVDHNHFVQIAQTHARIEDALRQTGLAYTILRPNWFSENFLGSAATIIHQKAIYGAAGEGKVAFIDSRDTADAAIAVLTDEDKRHIGKEYQLTGPEALTFAEASQELSKGLGFQVSYVNLTEEDYARVLADSGVPQPVINILLQINRNARENNLAEVTSDVQSLTGLSPRSLQTFARDYAQAFTTQTSQ
jgi:uncharacterized protein YbjT (DUF2867 family)